MKSRVHKFCLRVESGESPEELELLSPWCEGKPTKSEGFIGVWGW